MCCRCLGLRASGGRLGHGAGKALVPGAHGKADVPQRVASGGDEAEIIDHGSPPKRSACGLVGAGFRALRGSRRAAGGR